MANLKDRIISQIKETGPMSVAGYMAICLLDPTMGYYPTRDPLGEGGDFITAPEISQMFGEVLGLWAIDRYRALGSPDKIHLVEYGPGRGIMMSDMLRTARLDKNFVGALNVWLIETSAALESKQAEILADCGVNVSWVSKLEDVDEGDVLVIGNEYLDCLPVRQFIMQDRFAGNNGWHERLVFEQGGELRFGVSEIAISKADKELLPADLPDVKNGDLLEISPGLKQITESLKDRFAQYGGSALFIDYGSDVTEFGDTFQAIKNHKKQDPLKQPGQADLTARVDFAALAHWAGRAGLDVFGAVSQSVFLSRLGIELRAVNLVKSSPAAKRKIARQLHRLTDETQMGELFKAICLQSRGLSKPLGF